MWFGGSVADMLVAGAMAVTISLATTSKRLSFEEQVLSDVAASFVVGLSAGLLAIKWPHRFCFGAIALGSVMDYMQGFKVVFAVIEVMSRRNFKGPGSKLFFHMGVGNDRKTSSQNRQLQFFTDHGFVAIIFRVHSHSGIRQ